MDMCLSLLDCPGVDTHQMLERLLVFTLNLGQSKVFDLVARWTQGHDPL